MKYLIDGHNLIGKLEGISLSDPDDEAALMSRLRRYAARTGDHLTVFFDGGLPGGPSRDLSSGRVKVIFAPAGQPADPLIIQRIRRIQDRQGIVIISSDRAILEAAARHRVLAQKSEAFAAQLETSPPAERPPDPRQVPPSGKEVEAWLQEFGE